MLRPIPRAYALTAFIHDVPNVSIQAIWRQIDTVWQMQKRQKHGNKWKNTLHCGAGCAGGEGDPLLVFGTRM